MTPRCLVADELRSKRVIAPFAQSVCLSQGYYACTPDNKAQVPSLVTFRNWLLAQAQLPPAS